MNPPVTPIWVPSATRRTASNLWRWCEERGFEGYDEAWAWSVAPPSAGEFWRGISDYCGARWHRPPVAALEPAAERVSGYRWFRDGQLNYAERALQAPPGGPQSLAVVARSQARPASELTWADLSDLVARVRSGLVEAGIGAGERVAGYLPNIPEALAAMLACASVGAIWTACAPEMGVTGVVERLSQIGPAAFISVDGYRYGARAVDRRAEAEAIRARLPTVRTAVWLRYLEAEKAAPYGWQDWDQFVAVRARSSSPRSTSSIRSTSCFLRAPPGSRRPFCIATAGSCSSTPKLSGCISIWGPATGFSGSARRDG